MPSGSTGRLENRDPDHALITASLAAHRAARCRAADELLSAASRRSPGVNVSANTVPGWSTCSAKSGMETRSIPTPTTAMGGTLAHTAGAHIDVVIAEPRRRVEKHLGLLPLLRRLVAEPAVGRLLEQRPPTGDRRREPVLTGQHASPESLLVVPSLFRVERRDERLRVHQRHQAGHVTEPE